MKTVELKPTPSGVRHMQRMFEETKKGAEEKIALAETLAERIDTVCSEGKAIRFTDTEWELVVDALERLATEEYQRITSMEAGIAECEKSLEAEAP